MAYVIPLWQPPALPVAGSSDLFPVRRIYCVARNYAAHVREMGGDPTREPPFFFMKPANAIVRSGGTMPYPPATASVHHEVELVVALGSGGADIAADTALAHVFGYAVGLDMTRRDLQSEAKAAGRPWDMAKGFDHSAPCGMVHPAGVIGHPTRGAIQLAINGELKQRGDLSDLIWSVPEIIATLSRLVELAPGDLIYTGTPEGVGPIKAGDRLAGTVEGVGEVTVVIG